MRNCKKDVERKKSQLNTQAAGNASTGLISRTLNHSILRDDVD